VRILSTSRSFSGSPRPGAIGRSPAGWNEKHLSLPQRAALVAFRGLEGDFRDWAKIQAWAEETARELAQLRVGRRAAHWAGTGAAASWPGGW
jgi:hypothetical protein